MRLEEVVETLLELECGTKDRGRSFELTGAISHALEVARRDLLRSTCRHERTDDSTTVVGRRMHRVWCKDCGQTLKLEEV